MDLKRVLVSGASIAGPALGYWLAEYGFDVTIVERASAIRESGYPIDLRGTAVEVARRMGLEEDLKRAAVHVRQITFLDEDGKTLVSMPQGFTHDANDDIELPRGALTAALVAATKQVRYRFGDSISALKEDADGIDVTFASGATDRFELVIGADGIHSRTRRLVFGDEPQFTHSLGFSFAGFTMQNVFGLRDEAVVWATAGRSAMLYAIGPGPRLFGMFEVATPKLPETDEAVRAFMLEQYANDGWELQKMRDGIQKSEDLYFDEIAQIRMPAWSKGRVALVGDSAYAPSFYSGQGTSLALVGAYVLAQALSRHADHRDAFAEYEARCRPFVEANQALAEGSVLHAATREALVARNKLLSSMNALERQMDSRRGVYSLLKL